MRLTATWIGISLLLLCGCGVEPKSQADMRKELEKVAGPDPGTIETTMLLQAQKATADGNCKRAIENYQQLTIRKPANTEYAIDLADSERRCGDNETSIKILDGVLKKDPDNILALESKGLSLANTGEFTDASRIFGMVMKKDPKRWRTLNGIGILFTVKNMDTEAIEYYQAALDQSTNNPSVLNNLGLTYAMERQYSNAIAAFERAKRHVANDSPDLKNIDLNEALVYAISGDLDNAQQTAAPHLSKAGLYNNMGFYAYLSKNTDLAKSYLNMALTQSPMYYERAWKNLAVVTGENARESNADEPSANGSLNNSAPKPKAVFKTSNDADTVPASVRPAGIMLDEIPQNTVGAQQVQAPQPEPDAQKPPVKKTANSKTEKVKKDTATLPVENAQPKPTDAKPVSDSNPVPAATVKNLAGGEPSKKDDAPVITMDKPDSTAEKPSAAPVPVADKPKTGGFLDSIGLTKTDVPKPDSSAGDTVVKPGATVLNNKKTTPDSISDTAPAKPDSAPEKDPDGENIDKD